MGIEAKELEVLMQNYRASFSFASSLGNSLNAFNLSVEKLEDNDISTIRDALRCIAELFSDESGVAPIKIWKQLEDDVKTLSKSKNKKDIHIIFDSLSKIPPDLDPRSRRIKRTVLK
jgi:hypothetical protein